MFLSNFTEVFLASVTIVVFLFAVLLMVVFLVIAIQMLFHR